MKHQLKESTKLVSKKDQHIKMALGTHRVKHFALFSILGEGENKNWSPKLKQIGRGYVIPRSNSAEFELLLMIFSSCWVRVNIPHQVLLVAGVQRREWNLDQSETLHTVPVVDRVVRWSALTAAHVAPERAHHRRDSPLTCKESGLEKIPQPSTTLSRRSAQTHLQLAPTTFRNFPVCIMLRAWLPNEAGILFTVSSDKSSSPVIRLISNVDH